MKHLMLMIEIYRRLLVHYEALERRRVSQMLAYDEGKFDEARALNKDIIERHIIIDTYESIINIERAIEKEEVND